MTSTVGHGPDRSERRPDHGRPAHRGDRRARSRSTACRSTTARGRVAQRPDQQHQQQQRGRHGDLRYLRRPAGAELEPARAAIHHGRRRDGQPRDGVAARHQRQPAVRWASRHCSRSTAAPRGRATRNVLDQQPAGRLRAELHRDRRRAARKSPSRPTSPRSPTRSTRSSPSTTRRRRSSRRDMYVNPTDSTQDGPLANDSNLTFLAPELRQVTSSAINNTAVVRMLSDLGVDTNANDNTLTDSQHDRSAERADEQSQRRRGALQRSDQRPDDHAADRRSTATTIRSTASSSTSRTTSPTRSATTRTRSRPCRRSSTPSRPRWKTNLPLLDQAEAQRAVAFRHHQRQLELRFVRRALEPRQRGQHGQCTRPQRRIRPPARPALPAAVPKPHTTL